MAANEEEKTPAQQDNNGEEVAAQGQLLAYFPEQQADTLIIRGYTPEEYDEMVNKSQKDPPMVGLNRPRCYHHSLNLSSGTTKDFLITLQPNYLDDLKRKTATAEPQTPRCSFFGWVRNWMSSETTEPVATATSTATDSDGDQAENEIGQILKR